MHDNVTGDKKALAACYFDLMRKGLPQQIDAQAMESALINHLACYLVLRTTGKCPRDAVALTQNTCTRITDALQPIVADLVSMPAQEA